MDLHGADVVRLSVDWGAGALAIDLRLADGADVTIRAAGLRRLSVVWAFPGTDSRPVDRVDVGHEKLTIEMQGGGHIRLEAATIDTP